MAALPPAACGALSRVGEISMSAAAAAASHQHRKQPRRAYRLRRSGLDVGAGSGAVDVK